MRRFAFRSVQAEGYDAANILTAMAQVATHRYGAQGKRIKLFTF